MVMAVAIPITMVISVSGSEYEAQAKWRRIVRRGGINRGGSIGDRRGIIPIAIAIHWGVVTSRVNGSRSGRVSRCRSAVNRGAISRSRQGYSNTDGDPASPDGGNPEPCHNHKGQN